jgi:CheY-like chemotaxis protein
VDDEPAFRSAVSIFLRKAGFQTIEAGDGIEAYEIVRAAGSSVELLLTDLQMPRMDGLSLIESVRELHPKMPVLLLTATRFDNPPGGYAVLNKPIGLAAVLQAVRSAVDAAGAARPVRKVEVFRSSRCSSEELITAIRAAACPSCEVTVMDVEAAEAAERVTRLSVHSVPAVAINGELICCPCECGRDLPKLRAAGLGVPLSS